MEGHRVVKACYDELRRRYYCCCVIVLVVLGVVLIYLAVTKTRGSLRRFNKLGQPEEPPRRPAQ